LLRVALRGIVYTSMFNPTDGRKNWHDIVTAFCWAFRDMEDATLVMKFVRGAARDHRTELFMLLSRLAPYKCRVIAMDGFLEDADYDALIAGSSFYINASRCEGLCMPLMEFMSAGRPVIAPRHTAMADYIDENVAFIVGSSPEHNIWPDDPRHHYTTMRERIHWDTLVTAFAESYRTATQDPARYAEMGRNAAETMRLYCSDIVVRDKLRVAMDAALDAARKRAEAQAALDRIAAEQTAVTEPETA
jgi:glycosyltransferase involved in cell wall biosynthesis